MLKMERTCDALRCDVYFEGELVGIMEGVNLIQWFIKNKYSYRGSFSKFMAFDQEFEKIGTIFDIVFRGKKVIVRNVRIQWINAFGENGTFTASNLEYFDGNV